MQFRYAFAGSTTVESRADRTEMSFAPDTLRRPTYFSGELHHAVPFREAISALHDVVVSDLRTRPRDKSDYKAWAAEQEQRDWEQAVARRADIAKRMQAIYAEISQINQRRTARLQGFEQAKQRYFRYLYERDRDAWFVLDPVITVHPDELFFECFSQDESTYGRLGASYDVFGGIGDMACGTTNVDYSQTLYDEFQKIRSYKTTRLQVDPSGFDVQTTGGEGHKEVKIDLPDTWVRGFLQVSSAMTMGATSFDLSPVDVHGILHVLKRRKEKIGPRSLRYLLTPGKPIRVRIDPWGTELTFARSIYKGPSEAEVRVWGRRRLLILERLLPVARRFTVHLLGQGLPSFYVADLGDMSFTLGLSGWTSNDWSQAANFDLLAPRLDVDDATKLSVFDALSKTWLATPGDLARELGLSQAAVQSALAGWVQAGRVMFDLVKGVYRVRELSREPLPIEQLRFSNERETEAAHLADQGRVSIKSSVVDSKGELRLTGRVRVQKEHDVRLDIDADARLRDGSCTCSFYSFNKMHKGPCEHMLALRLVHARQARIWGGRGAAA